MSTARLASLGSLVMIGALALPDQASAQVQSTYNQTRAATIANAGGGGYYRGWGNNLVDVCMTTRANMIKQQSMQQALLTSAMSGPSNAMSIFSNATTQAPSYPGSYPTSYYSPTSSATPALTPAESSLLAKLERKQSNGPTSPATDRASMASKDSLAPDESITLKKALTGDDKDAREWAAIRLTAMGPAAIPVLTDALHNRKTDVRRLAAETLERMGSSARGATLALTKAADKDDDEGVRLAARSALSSIHPERH